MSACLSVHLSIRMEQLGSHWTDLYEIWYVIVFQILSRKFMFNHNLTRTTGILREDQSSNVSASVNPGLSTITVLPSSGHLQSHPYAKAPTFTMGYI
jgi:hypothetical protein